MIPNHTQKMDRANMQIRLQDAESKLAKATDTIKRAGLQGALSWLRESIAWWDRNYGQPTLKSDAETTGLKGAASQEIEWSRQGNYFID